MPTRLSPELDRDVATEKKPKRPSMFVVLVHNDDVTPRWFVVEILRLHFQKDEREATRIMLLAHTHGVGAVGKFTHEIAESKADVAMRFAREHGFPLGFSVQEE